MSNGHPLSVYNATTSCPSCGAHAESTIESRKTKEGFVRRRKECSECKARRTTYEVSREFYEKGSLLIKHVKRMEQILNEVKADDSKAAKCDSCVFNENNTCTFDLPEHSTIDSFDCTYYERS